MKRGLLIVFSGPSGVGKGTVLSKLMQMSDLDLVYSVCVVAYSDKALLVGELECSC